MDDGNTDRLLELLCHCDVHHTPCQPSFFLELLSSRYVSAHGGNAMPSRLLDLQTQDSANIKLVDTPFGARYATLSYRWGTSQPFELTRDNMPEAQAGVSVDRLAQAIQDAVTVSRSLFIRYLWVDALCIIQDGDGGQDWQAESKKLGLIYANSYVTIAAATDGDLSRSFLTSPREPYVKVPARSHHSAAPTGTVLFAPAFFDFSEKFENATYNNTLSTRAWVKQERVLSRRTIHFTSQGVYFECSNSYWSEEGTHQTGFQFDGRPATKFLSTLSVVDKSPEGAVRDLRLQLAIDAWYQLVEEYCTMSLIEETDRLFALSGLANLAAQVFPGAYLSGLWEHTLSSGLLWTPVSSPVVCTVTERSHAPSWSWASIPGPGNLRVAGNIDMANEDKSRIRYLRSERSEGCSEILVLEGTIVSCCVATRPETRLPFRKFKDPVPEEVDNFRFWPRAIGVHPELVQTCDNICRFDGERGHDLEFYFLRLRCSGPEGFMHCCGLLLRQVGEDSSANKALYRRIGIGWASHASWHRAVSLVRLQ